MIFSEIYGAYYNAAADIVKIALARNVTRDDIYAAAKRHAFAESGQAIESAIDSGRWTIISPDGSTPLKHEPTMPFTELEKRWLKSVSLDKRVKLFNIDFSFLDSVRPLFNPEDICIFDQYSDGDPYDDENYINTFRLILDAVVNKYPLDIEQPSRRGGVVIATVLPQKIEYSEKDDKFRLLCVSEKLTVINIARLTKCEKSSADLSFIQKSNEPKKHSVTLEVTNERNALERVFMHFAHFEKYAESLGENTYKITLYYDALDETEMIIRVLSFGPLVRVTEPQTFVNEITRRLRSQKQLTKL